MFMSSTDGAGTYGSKESDIYGALSIVLMLICVVFLFSWIFFKSFYEVYILALIMPYLALVFFVIGVGFLIFTISLRSKGH